MSNLQRQALINISGLTISISRISQRLTQKQAEDLASLACMNKALWLVISAFKVTPCLFVFSSCRCFRWRKTFFLLYLLKAHKEWWAPYPYCLSAALVKIPEGPYVKIWSYKSAFLPAEQKNPKISCPDWGRRLKTILKMRTGCHCLSERQGVVLPLPGPWQQRSLTCKSTASCLVGKEAGSGQRGARKTWKTEPSNCITSSGDAP